MPKAVFITSLPPDTAALLSDLAPADYDVTTIHNSTDVATQREVCVDADFLILFPGAIDSEVLRATKQLKLIQLVSAGFDKIDTALCRELGVPLANNGGANSIDVAEHTLALILAWYRSLPTMDSNVRNQAWKVLDSGSMTYTIRGKTVGIVGLGNIGRKVAQLLRAFGAHVLYTDAQPVTVHEEVALEVKFASLPGLLAQSDVVSLHVPLNDATHHLIGAEQLAQIQSHALLVNTCRGPVVDETALIAALQSGQIAGAALDVLDTEPPAPDNPLLSMDNVIITPHIAGVTRDTWARRGEFIFANLQRVWQGDPPQAQVG